MYLKQKNKMKSISKILNYFLITFIIKLTIISSNRNLDLTALCNIKNCISCKNRNECSKCKDGYELSNHRCFSKECTVYGFCSFCDEYDCLKCIKGYKLNYGICDEKIHGFEIKLILGIGIPLITISFIIYLYKCCKKRTRENIETGKILKSKHPRPGNYKILIPESKNDIEISLSKNSVTSTLENSCEKEKSEINMCVVCGKKRIYTFADCGCALCFEHYKLIKSNKETIKCRIHLVNLSKNIIFQLDRKSSYKGNALEKLGLSLCPMCKINQGTQSFNCGCNMRICEKCFNEYVYVLKYSQCPGCGKPYIPDKNNIRLRKKSNGGNGKGDLESTDKMLKFRSNDSEGKSEGSSN